MTGHAIRSRCPALVLFLAVTGGPQASDAIGLRPPRDLSPKRPQDGPKRRQDGPKRAFDVSQLDDLITGSSLGMGAFSFLVGDEDGIHYARSVDKNASPFHDGANPRTPFPVFSAGKWPVAAAIGAAVQAGDFGWDDKVGEYISWWTCSDSEDDQRCHITFRHLLSHTSGLTASSTFLATVGWESDNSSYVGLWNTSYTLEDCAKAVYHGSEHIPRVPAPYRYGESHYFVAQLAAMRATGMATWQDFFSKYFATKLGLRWEVTDGALSSSGRFFLAEDAAYTYGFASYNASTGNWATGEQIANPDGGSQLIASACTFSRFLTSYLRRGDDLYGARDLDMDYTGDGTCETPVGDGYALGHWLLSGMRLMHSIGFGGTLPVIATAPTGKKFWIHIQHYKPGEYVSSFQLLVETLPMLYELMASPPAVNTTVCASL